MASKSSVIRTSRSQLNLGTTSLLGSMAVKSYVHHDLICSELTLQQDNPDPNLFATEVRNCAGSNVALILWNANGSRTRTIALHVPTPSPTLGITLQWTPLSVTEDVWHVLDVIPNSPADTAGLLPYGDYIVGTPEGNVHGEAGLGELVEDTWAALSASMFTTMSTPSRASSPLLLPVPGAAQEL